jgi:regulator of nucleoside diphosphate kinase
MTRDYDSVGATVVKYAWFVGPGGEPPHFDEDEDVKRRKGSAGKDDLVISSFDKQRLMRLLSSAETSAEDRAELEDLTHEIERGAEVQPQDIPPDVVTMNSTVRVTDVEAGTSHTYTIVFPADADYEKGKISILAPLGTALLGFRIGDVVDWHMPGGTRRLRIDALVYQPEAAGDFHL